MQLTTNACAIQNKVNAVSVLKISYKIVNNRHKILYTNERPHTHNKFSNAP